MDEHRNRPRGHVVIEIGALFALLACSLHGFTTFVDLHLADEIGYRLAGRELFEGEASARMLAYAPLYTALYGVADLIASAPGRAVQDGVATVTAALFVAASWWTLRALLPPTTAFLAAAFWCTTAQIAILDAIPRTSVHLFSATVTTVAIGCFARGRTTAGFVALALAAFNRVELAPWLLGVACFGRDASRRSRITFAALAIGFVAMHAILPDARDRSWLVFSQHFALGQAERDPEGIVGAPMEYHASVTTDAFGSARSIPGALAANPAAFARHVAGNALILPGGLLRTVYSDRDPHGLVWLGLSTGLVLLAMIGAVRGRARAPAASDLRPTAVWSMRLSLLCIPIALLVRPRPELLMPATVWITVVVARAIATVRGAPTRRDRRIWPAIAVLGVAALAPSRRAAGEAPSLPLREAVAALAHTTPPRTSTLFATFARGLSFAAGHEVPTNGFVGTGPAAARPGDRLLFTSYDVVLHSTRIGPWIDDIADGRWRLTHGGLGVWLFERV